MSTGQVALAIVLLGLMAGLLVSSISAQKAARSHTETFLRTETSATNATTTLRESLNYGLTVQDYLLGVVSRRSVQIARALLAQRLTVVDETGLSAGAETGPAYLEALTRLDAVVAGLPAGMLPETDRVAARAQAAPAVDALNEASRRLIDRNSASYREQSRLYDEQLIASRGVELALLLGVIGVAGVLLGWMSVGVRRNYLHARAAIAKEELELELTRQQVGRLAALDHGKARILELIASGADLPTGFEATADAVSAVAGGQATRVRWGDFEVWRGDGAGRSANAEVGWSSTFGMGLYDDGSGEVAVFARPEELDEAAITGAMRCRDLAKLAVETDLASQQLSFQATHDALTGLSTRNRLLVQLEEQLHLSVRTGFGLAILMCDLDRFKVVNDSLGHAVGDLLLIEVTARLREVVRDVDIVARTGGDEFVVLCPLLTDADDAAVLARRILEVLSATYRVDGRDAFVGVSIGVSYADDPALTGHELMRAADLAMCRAKGQGGSQVSVFDHLLDTQTLARTDIDTALRYAVERHDLFTELQPIVRLADGRITGFEALLRLRRPGGEVCMPSEFLPIAERNGSILGIGRWVLRQTIGMVADWRSHGLGDDVTIAVNVSARQIRDRTFVDDLFFILEEFSVPASALVLELAEDALLDLNGSAARLAALRAAGVRVSLDDFGTGHSSLTRLRELPIDEVKLDPSFSESPDGEQHRAVLASIVALASALALGVVVEGVETTADRDLLNVLGVGHGQGFVFGAPMGIDAAERLLHDIVVADERAWDDRAGGPAHSAG